MRKKKKLSSPIKQKVLLLLASGLTLGLTRSAKKQWQILKNLSREWNFIDRRYLFQIIREFKLDRLISHTEKETGEVEIVITEKGQRHSLLFDPDKLKIVPPKHWDEKWRLVMFDIPETKKSARNALRLKLRELGFQEFQRSVFIHPHECEKEINFIVEFFEVRSYVRLITAEKITNEAELLLKFDLKKKS
ncbi:MAG: CRISPR-associated endonuclease Cas2 [Patescibacteria group bacterium]